MNAQNYVAGFMFDADLARVALIRKMKPAWQRGKLNGIGGKIEAGERALAAMVREFREETGAETQEHWWRHFMAMDGNNDGGSGDFRVDFFVAVGSLSSLRSPEEEKIELIAVESVTPHRKDMIENLPWLIPLALDFLRDGRPSFVTARYP